MKFDIQGILLGLAISVLTALGCFFYSKIVKGCHCPVIFVMNAIYPTVLLGAVMLSSDFRKGVVDLFRDPRMFWYALAYMAIYMTVSILWVWMTQRTSVTETATFEIAYVPFLVLGPRQ
jgi:drug/metabolite transporter (DMT)-like permease